MGMDLCSDGLVQGRINKCGGPVHWLIRPWIGMGMYFCPMHVSGWVKVIEFCFESFSCACDYIHMDLGSMPFCLGMVD